MSGFLTSLIPALLAFALGVFIAWLLWARRGPRTR
jgi:hypothetical protein